MKRDELQAKLSEVEDGDYSAVIDWVMSANGDDINKAKDGIKSLKDELAELKAAKKAAEEAKLSDEEKLQARIKELDDQKAELDRDRNRIAAKSKLVDAGLSGEELEKVLDRFVSADQEATEATVTAFVEVLRSQKDSAVAAAKAELITSTGNPAGAANPKAGGVTKEEFLKMGYTEKVALKDKDPEAYRKLRSE